MSNDQAPILMRWTGERFEPLDRFRERAESRYVAGQVYTIKALQQRSQASHNFYFAAVQRAWENLPEGLSEEFADANQLRKFALIKTDHYDKQQLVCANNQQAQATMAFMPPSKDYSIVELDGRVITRYTAKTQKQAFQDRNAFEKSKNDVLDYLSALIGVDVATLVKQPKAA